MTTNETFEYISKRIKDELMLPVKQRSNYKTAIYLVPETVIFIFNDCEIPYKQAIEMIEMKYFVYKKLVKHQGELMYSYELNHNFKK